ncbi:MAG: LytTR family DNA-binding domain-containing protein [Clostridiales bacterium]|nr:LytTR family DNA-binding domain-containing protein [Clostridiales bacterium]MCD7828026.1 LytTR family DNA-binding domain-containing protein [Clostridiales bacterium]
MVEIALFDTNPDEQYQLDDMLSSIMFSRDDFKITFYSSYTLFACDLAQKRRYFDILFVNVSTEDRAGLNAAEYARLYSSTIEIVLIGTDYKGVRLGYRVKALDYVLKPYNKMQLTETIDRFYKFAYRDDCFVYKNGSAMEKIKTDNILYVMSSGRKLILMELGGRTSEFYGKLDTSCQGLLEKGFIRVHQSYLVNIRFVRFLTKDKVVMENDDEIPISRTRYEDVKDVFMNLVGAAAI